MRRKLVLGVCLGTIAGGTVAAQFATERGPVTGPIIAQPQSPSPPAPTRYEPAPRPPVAPVVRSSAGYVPPVSTLQPASFNTAPDGTRLPPLQYATLPTNLEIKTALGHDHPWLLKPEHGPYFIMVKSYVRPAKGSKAAQEDRGLSARELAEGLATEIRETYLVQAFLFEYISEERKAEMRQIAAARQKAASYVAQVDELRRKSQLQGHDFLEPDNKIHVMTHHHRDQIGVLVGGFQSEDDAKKALVKLKTWPTPKNEVLVDKGAMVLNGKTESVKTTINPYASAFVVPNPSIVRPGQTGPQRGVDPFIVRLNEGQPYNLLNAKKEWTLAVKSFTSPVEFVNKDSDTSLMKKIGLSKGADALAAGAEQAENMAKALRAMKGPNGESLNLEAFVLHTRNASLVTIGQFDGPDDPALHAMKRTLTKITQTKFSSDPDGLRPLTNMPTLFGNFMPMPIPKP